MDLIVPLLHLPEQTSWSWLAVVLLGMYHGINPAMGWLFAVSFGLQRRSLKAVLFAVGPIALGHEASIAAFVLLFRAGDFIVSTDVIRASGAIALIGFGIFKLVRPRFHPKWVGMNVNGRDLVLWSFLMSTAHGAGLMLLPAVFGLSTAAAVQTDTLPAADHFHLDTATLGRDLLAVMMHTAAMLAVMATVAVVVYQKVGLEILRHAWINVDVFWAIALILTGTFTLLT